MRTAINPEVTPKIKIPKAFILPPKEITGSREERGREPPKSPCEPKILILLL